MPPGYSASVRAPSTKKALLVGIRYDCPEVEGEWGLIPTSIANVKSVEAFLRKYCGYTEIIIMTDEAGVEDRFRPTKNNLKREIEALCLGVKPEDRRFFYFAGHSHQLTCNTGSEDDGMDEAVIAADGLEIRDNMLRKLLVNPLPKGSSLIAIFDSCNSGTLLDLDHYKCNTVYRPWINKGRRRSNTLQNHVVRKGCRWTRSRPPKRRRTTILIGSGGAHVNFRSLTQAIGGMRRNTESEQEQLAKESKESDKHYGERCMSPDRDRHEGEGCTFPERGKFGVQRCASPEPMFKCEGWCREETSGTAPLDHPDVISISSSNDGQISWDASTRNGGSISMTTSLIGILEEHPQITLHELMTRLNHEVHKFTRKMHDSVKKESRARRKADRKRACSEGTELEPKGEMNNFQDLQLGSMAPVDWDRPFVI